MVQAVESGALMRGAFYPDAHRGSRGARVRSRARRLPPRAHLRSSRQPEGLSASRSRDKLRGAMPPTPLLQLVADLLRDAVRPPHAAAPPPADVDRRQFLAASGLAGLSAALPFPRGGWNARQARVAVVGGGLAGLTCAYRLKQS